MDGDTELVKRMLNGDEAAFDRFIDDYYPRLYRFAYRRVAGNRDLALDVVQASFEKLIPRLSSWRAEAPLFSWMCGFCRFEIGRVWKNEARELAEDEPNVRAVLDSLAVLDASPERELELKELGLVQPLLGKCATKRPWLTRRDNRRGSGANLQEFATCDHLDGLL